MQASLCFTMSAFGDWVNFSGKYMGHILTGGNLFVLSLALGFCARRLSFSFLPLPFLLYVKVC